MRRIACLICLLVCSSAPRAGAQTITVTQPASGANSVASADDFATQVFQDPWDMNQRSDPGWWLNSVDMPMNGFSSTTFTGGIFTGTISADPNIWLLETGLPNLPPIGKTGKAFPLNATRYRILALRMRASHNGYMLFHWSANTMYDPPGLVTAGISGGAPQAPTSPGWRYYFVDLAAMGIVNGTGGWSGMKGSLRLDPAPDDAPAGSTLDIDWVRLVENQPSLSRTIQWSGTGPVDIYLDNNNSATSDPAQTLGLVASNVGGSSYNLNVGALAPGDYYVAIRRSGTSNSFSYSPGFYRVNAATTVTVTSPSDEGSSDDFATTHLNNPWDMTTNSDIDAVINVTGNGVSTVAGVESEAGTSLGDITAYIGASTQGVTDPAPCASFAKPVIYPMHASVRGVLHRIDPNRYRILTAELGLPNRPRDLCGGSIVRFVWQVAGAPAESYSWGIAVNSRSGANVLNRFNLDMADLPIDPGSPSQLGWVPGSSSQPGISGFRIDPHEFVNPTWFYVKRVKLAALETAHTSYLVRWTLSKTGGTVRVYYDDDKDPAGKTLIGSTSASSLNGTLSWNTSGLTDGQEYFVYVEIDDGSNVNGTYSKWPVKIDHTPMGTARLVMNRTTLNFGVTNQTIKTPPQTIRLTAVNASAGQPCWTATSDLNFLTVTPASGCGSAVLTVALANQSYPGFVDHHGVIRVTSNGAINSPQFARTIVRIRHTSAGPSGVIDTPANGSQVSGSVAVTGWAVDDIGISRVSLCRDPVGGEVAPHPACGANQIYIGDAVSIEDARPDIEAYSWNTPLNYRAGWGFLVLTNMLPNQGNGQFTIYAHAIDIEGFRAPIGFRVIFGQNSSAIEPFGTIDTPAQGETVGGSYANFGWVLSRVRRADPPGGGAVSVYVDGVLLGSPCCWTNRSDLTALFPGYPGISRALGVFGLDTTAFANGLHTIVWVVTDNGGVSNGVGSRYFSIFNPGGSVSSAVRPIGPDLGRHTADLGGALSRDTIAMREGYGLTTAVRPVSAGFNGTRRVWATERDRVEIRLAAAGAKGNSEYAAYHLVDGRLQELPNGASFDPERGVFYWQPGLGYMGDYDLMFVRSGVDGTREQIPVRVTLQPRPTRLASRLDGPWGKVAF